MVGGFQKDSSANPGSRTAAFTKDILQESEIAYSIESKCALSDEFANRYLMLNSRKSVLKIYHPYMNCTVATRISWVTDKVTDGRSCSYAFSHIFTNDDSLQVLQYPAGLFSYSAYESYDSVVKRLHKTRARTTLNERYTGIEKVITSLSKSVFYDVGFNEELFSYYISGIVRSISSKSKLFIIIPQTISDSWGSSIDYIERLMSATIEMMPMILRKKITLVSRGPLDENDISLKGINIIFYQRDSGNYQDILQTLNASCIDLSDQKAYKLSNEKLRQYSSFLWDALETPNNITLFENYIHKLCGEYLKNITVTEDVLATLFAMWRANANKFNDIKAVKSGITSAIELFSGVLDKFPQAEIFLHDGLNAIKGKFNEDIEESLIYLALKNNKQYKYHMSLQNLLLSRIIEGTDNEQIIKAFFNGSVSNQLIMRLEILFKSSEIPSNAFVLFTKELLSYSQKDHLYKEAWKAFTNWCEVFFTKHLYEKITLVIDHLFKIGPELRNKDLSRKIKIGILELTSLCNHSLFSEASKIIMQDANFFTENFQEYRTLFKEYMGLPYTKLNQIVLLPYYWHWCALKCEIDYEYNTIIQWGLSRDKFLVDTFIKDQDYIWSKLLEHFDPDVLFQIYINVDQVNRSLGLKFEPLHIKTAFLLFTQKNLDKKMDFLFSYCPYMNNSKENADLFISIISENNCVSEFYFFFLLSNLNTKYIIIWEQLKNKVLEDQDVIIKILECISKTKSTSISQYKIEEILQIYLDNAQERSFSNILDAFDQINLENKYLEHILKISPTLKSKIIFAQFTPIKHQIKDLNEKELCLLETENIEAILTFVKAFNITISPDLKRIASVLVEIDQAIKQKNYYRIEEICLYNFMNKENVRNATKNRIILHRKNKKNDYDKRGCSIFIAMLSQSPVMFKSNEYLKTVAPDGATKNKEMLYYLDLMNFAKKYLKKSIDTVIDSIEIVSKKLLRENPQLIHDISIIESASELRECDIKTKILAGRLQNKNINKKKFTLEDLLITCLFFILSCFLFLSVCIGLLWIYKLNPFASIGLALILLIISIVLILYWSPFRRSIRR